MKNITKNKVHLNAAALEIIRVAQAARRVEIVRDDGVTARELDRVFEPRVILQAVNREAVAVAERAETRGRRIGAHRVERDERAAHRVRLL